MSSLSLPSTVTNLPQGTKILTGILILTSILLSLLKLFTTSEGSTTTSTGIKSIFHSNLDSNLNFPWLILVPGNFIWYPWTLLLSSFAESNIIEFGISVVALPLAGRYLERVWGFTEFLKFVGVVLISSNIIAVFVNIIEGIVLGNVGFYLYGMGYHGMMALQIAFLVAFTQLIPEHQVQIFGGLAKIRVKSLPMLYVTFSNIACILGYQSPYILIQFGWLSSWFYLRFVKLNEAGIEYRGDRSETFSFASWFPSFAQKHIAKGSNFIFNLAVKLNILKGWTDIESGGASGISGGSYVLGGQPSGTRAEAERRRAMALQALDQRMATVKPPVPTSTPPIPSTTTPTSLSVPLPTSTSTTTIKSTEEKKELSNSSSSN